MDVNWRLIDAVRKGRLEEARKLIDSFGLSYSPAWSEGYVLLCYALKNGQAAVAKLLLASGCKVNSKTSCIKSSDTPLHFAVQGGAIEIVKIILDKGADINAKNKEGKTPLYNAIKYNRIEVVELLLKHAANIHDRDKEGEPLFHVAVQEGCLKIVEHLLKFGANVNCSYTVKWGGIYAPLLSAVDLGFKEIVTVLLSRGAHVDFKGEDGKTCLHVAADEGYATIAEDLVNHGAYIHSLTLKEEYTPLHFASKRGNEVVVKLLLDKGADSNARTKDNLTPLHIATKNGHITVVRLLLEHGAKVDNEDKDGKTILHHAVKNGSLAIVEDVLKYCPDINNQSNRNTLKIAVLGYRESYKKIVKALLEYGLIVNPEDANDPKLLHNAIENGHFKIVGDLLKYGANVNALHRSGFTALHTAAAYKQEEVAELLISYEADINALDKSRKTPIFYAIENVDLKMTKLLLSNGANIKNSPKLLNMAVEKKQIEIVEALLQLGADVNACDKYGRTALHVIAKNKNKNYSGYQTYESDSETAESESETAESESAESESETAESESEDYLRLHTYEDPNIDGKIATLLLSKGANVNAKQNDGMTALHIAIQMGHKDIVEILLECGAKVENGTLHLAAERGCCKIIKTIMTFITDINSKDNYGKTALHIASQKGHTKAVATLLHYGADVNIMCKNDTPHDYARIGVDSFYMQQRNDLSYVDSDDSDGDYCYRKYFSIRGICSHEATAKVLELHTVKMRTAKLYVKKISRLFCGSSELMWMENDCKEEIEIMKSANINNTNVSFYDILAKGINSTAMYLRNENIFLALKSGDYKTKFPLYARIIELNFNKGLKRKELLEQGNKVSHLLFNNFPDLPQDCTEKILCYLNDNDLRILIKACKPI